MQSAIEQFRRSVVQVRNIGVIHSYLSNMTTSALDKSDLLRTQIVMCVSALDYYIHEVTRVGMVETLQGIRPATPAFRRFGVSLESALLSHSTSNDTTWLDSEIRSRHSLLSFQHPDKIAEAIRLISSIELWNSVATALHQDSTAIKTRLNLIIQRRNKIAHEADVDPTYSGTGTRWPITPILASESVDFVELVCETIHKLI